MWRFTSGSLHIVDLCFRWIACNRSGRLKAAPMFSLLTSMTSGGLLTWKATGAYLKYLSTMSLLKPPAVSGGYASLIPASLPKSWNASCAPTLTETRFSVSGEYPLLACVPLAETLLESDVYETSRGPFSYESLCNAWRSYSGPLWNLRYASLEP